MRGDRSFIRQACFEKTHRFPKENIPTSYSQSAVGTGQGGGERGPQKDSNLTFAPNIIKASWAPWQGCCVRMGPLPLVHLPNTYIWLELELGFVNPKLQGGGGGGVQPGMGQPRDVLALLRRARIGSESHGGGGGLSCA